MTTVPASKSHAVAPASPWLALWIWLPLLGAGIANAFTSPRNGLTIGVSLFVLAVGIVLHRAFNRRRIRVQGRQLEVVSTFYRKCVDVSGLRLEQARVVDLAEHHEYRPGFKTNGFGMPGFQSGHFRMRGGAKAFCLLTDRSRVLVLPLRDGSMLLLSPEQPRALLDELKRLA
ncbi:conserved exported hypothetical protein [uncultured Stenotrophomonas sp.]|uniref:Bacterial Pleckstrin homology domain-containing protein n=1 Tax=uncultured Stenotrophomonas sp. TaxID=165438 RepID=A0A1Y5Q2U0_9GAMM|nr:conserved exported hypothetical protein [uncultured Stenotrophomonas sp.]